MSETQTSQVRLAKKPFGCGDPECGASTNIAEDPTFGRGFDFMTGLFESPCAPCARAYEAAHPGEQAWPYKESA